MQTKNYSGSSETLSVLLWLSETEAEALAEMAAALRSACGERLAILTVRSDAGIADVGYSRPISLAMLAQ